VIRVTCACLLGQMARGYAAANSLVGFNLQSRLQLGIQAGWISSRADAHFIPRSVNTLGFSSPAARTWWHAEQSFVMVWPSALV
jgi:hypothetical protein